MVVNTTKKKKQTSKRLQKTRLYVTYRRVFKVAYVDLYIHIYNIYIYIYKWKFCNKFYKALYALHF